MVGLALTANCTNVARKEGNMSVANDSANKGTESKCDSSVSPPPDKSSYTWVNVTNDAAYAPRDGGGALVFNEKMWLLGGWNPGDKKHFPRICNNEVWSSRGGVTWSLEKPNTFVDERFDPALDWEGRHTAGYVVYKDKMWIVGHGYL